MGISDYLHVPRGPFSHFTLQQVPERAVTTSTSGPGGPARTEEQRKNRMNHRHTKRNKKKGVIVGLLVAALIGGSVAYALWTASGSGSGSAKAITAQTITVNASTGAADLYPGFTGGKVFFTLTNPNPYAVTMTNMTSGAITSSDPANCPSTNITVANASGLTLAAAANSTTGQLSIPNVVSMASSAPDGCQGVTFTVALTLTGTQS
jgi:hypothetical protein